MSQKEFNSSASETRPNTNFAVKIAVDTTSGRGTVTLNPTPPSTRDPQKDLVKK